MKFIKCFLHKVDAFLEENLPKVVNNYNNRSSFVFDF